MKRNPRVELPPMRVEGDIVSKKLLAWDKDGNIIWGVRYWKYKEHWGTDNGIIYTTSQIAHWCDPNDIV